MDKSSGPHPSVEDLIRYKKGSDAIRLTEEFTPNRGLSATATTRHEISNLPGFKEQKDLGRYLGALITNNGRSTDNFKKILGRVYSKLKGWKTKCLSLAGRLTLAQTILNLVLNYNMQHERISKGIYLEVKKIQRSFIWGEEPNQRRMHLIGWKTLCQPKHLGVSDSENFQP
ncbi:hypothetical protein AHAS_Ahas13G0117200 [Arachis hypogaea]